MAGLGEELAGLGFGAQLGDALARIGQTVRKARDEQRIKDITGNVLADIDETKDLFSPDFIRRYQSAIGELTSIEGGDRVINQINQALDVPLKMNQERLRLADEDRSRIMNEIAPIVNPLSTGIAQYNSDLGKMDLPLAKQKHAALASGIEALEMKYGKNPVVRPIIDNLRTSLVVPSGLGPTEMAGIQYKKSQALFNEAKANVQEDLSKWYAAKAAKDRELAELAKKPETRHKAIQGYGDNIKDLLTIKQNMIAAKLFAVDDQSIAQITADIATIDKSIQEYKDLQNSIIASLNRDNGRNNPPANDNDFIESDSTGTNFSIPDSLQVRTDSTNRTQGASSLEELERQLQRIK